MNRRDCRITRQEIDQSELNAKLSEQAMAHTATCSSCHEFRNERTQLRELVGSLEPVTAPANFDMRLRARLAAERQIVTRQPFFAGFAIGTPAVAVAALLVISIASVVWFVQHNRIETTPVASQPVQQPSTPGRTPVVDPNTSQSLAGVDRAVATSVNGGNQGVRDKRPSALSPGTRATQPNPSRDFGVGGARSIKQVVDSDGEVSFAAPGKPMVLSMQDDRGATRRISLPPVSFGSQRLVDNRIPVSQTNARIW